MFFKITKYFQEGEVMNKSKCTQESTRNKHTRLFTTTNLFPYRTTYVNEDIIEFRHSTKTIILYLNDP